MKALQDKCAPLIREQFPNIPRVLVRADSRCSLTDQREPEALLQSLSTMLLAFIGAPRGLLARHHVAPATPSSPEWRFHFLLGFFKVMFLRDKDWAQVVKTNHYLSHHYLTLGGEFKERSV